MTKKILILISTFYILLFASTLFVKVTPAPVERRAVPTQHDLIPFEKKQANPGKYAQDA